MNLVVGRDGARDLSFFEASYGCLVPRKEGRGIAARGQSSEMASVKNGERRANERQRRTVSLTMCRSWYLRIMSPALSR
jgi:hypothetical protein